MQVNETLLFIYFSMNGQGRHFFLKNPLKCIVIYSWSHSYINFLYHQKIRLFGSSTCKQISTPDLVFTFEMSLSLCCTLFSPGGEALWFCRGVCSYPTNTLILFLWRISRISLPSSLQTRILDFKCLLCCDYPESYGWCYCNAYHYNCNVYIIIMIHTVWLLSQNHLYCILYFMVSEQI